MLAIKMIGNQLQAIFSNMATVLFHGIVPNKKQLHYHLLNLSTLYSIGISNAAKEALWLKHILVDLGRVPRDTLIYCDNKSALCLAKNPEMHARSNTLISGIIL